MTFTPTIVVIPSIAGIQSLLLAILLSSCSMDTPTTTFTSDLEDWRAQRYADLKAPDGYLALAGLFWLEDGDHTFGSDSSNDLVFPPHTPSRIGSFVVQDSTVTMRVENGASVLVEGQIVSEFEMIDDEEGAPTFAHLDSLNWHVINRSKGIAVRLLDIESEARRSFDGIDFFEPDPSWSIQARFEPYDPPLVIDMPSITGVDEKATVPGMIAFNVGDEEFRLEVTGKPGDERYFVVFGDATSGQETYGGGRFVWIDVEDEEGNITVDFNRAYNPPCVFSPYATCPLPTPSNRLPLRIEAGELNYGGH